MAGAWDDSRTLPGRHLPARFSLARDQYLRLSTLGERESVDWSWAPGRLDRAHTDRTPEDGQRLPVELLLGSVPVLQPELRLMRAVLEDALIVVTGPTGAGHPRLVVEGAAWLASGDESYLFSFLRICEALDLDASRLRSRVASWLAARASNDGQRGQVASAAGRRAGT